MTLRKYFYCKSHPNNLHIFQQKLIKIKNKKEIMNWKILLILFLVHYFEMRHGYSKGSCKCDTLASPNWSEWVLLGHLPLPLQQRKYDTFWCPLRLQWHCTRLAHPLKRLSNIHSLLLYFLSLCWKSNEHPHLKVPSLHKNNRYLSHPWTQKFKIYESVMQWVVSRGYCECEFSREN